MIGEVSLDGVFVPTLLMFACGAFMLTGLLTRFLSEVGFYRFIVHRPVTDLAIFLLVLATIVRITERWGLHL